MRLAATSPSTLIVVNAMSSSLYTAAIGPIRSTGSENIVRKDVMRTMPPPGIPGAAMLMTVAAIAIAMILPNGRPSE